MTADQISAQKSPYFQFGSVYAVGEDISMFARETSKQMCIRLQNMISHVDCHRESLNICRRRLLDAPRLVRPVLDPMVSGNMPSFDKYILYDSSQ
jgi:hypothetical protein